MENINQDEYFKNLLTKKEVAKMLFVHYNTINYWIKTGKIEYIKLGTNKQSPIRFNRQYIEQLIRDKKGVL